MLKSIIDAIEETIEQSGTRQPRDYAENCLLFDPDAGADYYDITVDQFKYCVNRAVLRCEAN